MTEPPRPLASVPSLDALAEQPEAFDAAPLPPDVLRTVVDALAAALVAEIQAEGQRGEALHRS